MASGTFILRPSADVSVEHELNPSGGSAYLLINEQIADGESTYISGSASASTGTNSDDSTGESWTRIQTSVFKLSGNIPTSRFKITDITIYCNYRLNTGGGGGGGGVYISLSCDGAMSSEFSQYKSYLNNMDSYETASGSISNTDFLNTINDNLAIFNSLELIVTTENDGSATSKSSYSHEAYISQIYVEVSYEEGMNIYHKVNGSWKQAQAAYQKQNGVWVEITEDECKNILASSLCSK